MGSALRQYAASHDGWFPKDGKTPLQSLQFLCPDEIGDPCLLAGISGHRDETVRRLQVGEALDESVSSWIYFPGFHEDDSPDLALIWERQEGVYFNGRRAPGGHSVAFADGRHGHVGQNRWPSFVKEQAVLREQILANRHADASTRNPIKRGP